MSKFTVNKLNIAQIFFLLFLASLFFPIRYVFPTLQAFQTGAYSDFTSVSLYLSDIFLFITCLFLFLPRGGSFLPRGENKMFFYISFFWLILNIIWHIRSTSTLNLWFFGKYLELGVSYGTTYYLFSKTSIKGLFIKFFVLFSSFESILAIWQFITQKSLGLGKMGEQVLSPTIKGVAKIVSGGTTLIRGYGTFPHPNLLSAFLVTGALLGVYLLTTTESKKIRLIYSPTILINLFGLAVTFSRAAFLAMGVGLIIFFFHLLRSAKPETKKQIYSTILIVFASILLTFYIFKPFILTRATVSDDAALERVFYAKLGWQMVKQHPIFGVGIGESVLHMQQYAPFKLWPWQIQPVHNYFLLAAAELGIPGALIFAWIFLGKLKAISKKLKTQKTLEYTTYCVVLTAILVSFLLLMQFDHYFYTLQQTQMLLWVILGIISAEIKNPHPQSAEGDKVK